MLTSSPNDLESFWMPYTANRQFKAQPRLFVSAKDMHYRTSDGRAVLDGTAGLWCCNAGHSRPKIVEAVQRQIEELDYAPAFQMGHPKAFELANRLVQLTPEGLDHVFFTNSGSEAVDTALKTALAYHQARGQGSRVRLIGRERGYHGSGFGGVSTGGISSNREAFGPLLPGVDHLRHTHDPNRNAFSRGIPEHGMSSPTIWSALSRFTAPPRSRPLSSSQSQVQPGFSCRQKVIWSVSERYVTSMAFS